MEKILKWMCKHGIIAHKYPWIVEQFNTRHSNICERCGIAKWNT